jgi:hypothetical protein
MVLKRKFSIDLGQLQQQDGSENPSTPSILTPNGGLHFHRLLSQETEQQDGSQHPPSTSSTITPGRGKIFRRAFSIELPQKEGSQNQPPPTPSTITPSGGKDFRRLFSQQNGGKSNDKYSFSRNYFCDPLSSFFYNP